MKKILKGVIKIFFTIILAALFYLNIAMYHAPTYVKSADGNYNQDVYYQLQFLKSELHQGAGDDMQFYFPEGFMFINALYGLSWCDLIKPLNPDSPIYREGIEQIDWAIKQVKSQKAKNIFDPNLLLSNGAFYIGWKNYLIGSKLELQNPNDRNELEEAEFKKACSKISQAFDKSHSPFLESYSGLSWPADATIAMACLSIHDKLSPPLYSQNIENWIVKVKNNLDTITGLIPHQSEIYTGKSIAGARGSSQSLILNFLFDIDETFAKTQFEIYKDRFLDYRIGLPGIREYPSEIQGPGDIDSGPVILGIGGAASIVGQRTFFKYGDVNTYKGLRNSIEGFGLGFTIKKKKKYLFGKLPMADAFICWSNAIEKVNTPEKSNWRLSFQFLSFLLAALLFLLLIKL